MVWPQQLVGEIISVSVFNLEMSSLFDFQYFHLNTNQNVQKRQFIHYLHYLLYIWFDRNIYNEEF